MGEGGCRGSLLTSSLQAALFFEHPPSPPPRPNPIAGSTANRVKSLSWSGYSSSFRFRAIPQLSCRSTNADARLVSAGEDTALYQCPAGCTEDLGDDHGARWLYGTKTYRWVFRPRGGNLKAGWLAARAEFGGEPRSRGCVAIQTSCWTDHSSPHAACRSDSRVCLAAYHAGVLASGGGVVILRYTPGPRSYKGEWGGGRCVEGDEQAPCFVGVHGMRQRLVAASTPALTLPPLPIVHAGSSYNGVDSSAAAHSAHAFKFL